MSDRVHELKVWPEFYEPLKTGEKTFEVRLNDRDYRVGDLLHLREYKPGGDPPYTGRSIYRRVTYLADLGIFNHNLRGMVAMTAKPDNQPTPDEPRLIGTYMGMTYNWRCPSCNARNACYSDPRKREVTCDECPWKGEVE